MSDKYSVEIVPMSEFTPDDHNANQGTMRGDSKLEDSIQMAGHGRSGLLDKHGKIIAGNKFHAKSGELGAEEAIVIKVDGTTPVFVQRIDLDLDKDERARMLAYYDNVVAQMNLSWNPLQISADLEAGLPLEKIWTAEELSKFLGTDETPYPKENNRPLPPPSYKVVVICQSEDDAQSVYSRLLGDGLNCELEIK